jgi:hypothetical protein
MAMKIGKKPMKVAMSRDGQPMPTDDERGVQAIRDELDDDDQGIDRTRSRRLKLSSEGPRRTRQPVQSPPACRAVGTVCCQIMAKLSLSATKMSDGGQITWDSRRSRPAPATSPTERRRKPSARRAGEVDCSFDCGRWSTFI